MRIVIGSDHAGYALKMQIKTYLEAKNYTVIDVGTDSAAESVSYVDYGRSAAAEIVSGGPIGHYCLWFRNWYLNSC